MLSLASEGKHDILVLNVLMQKNIQCLLLAYLKCLVLVKVRIVIRNTRMYLSALSTRGVQKVHRLTQLTARYAHHILSLFNIDTCN